MGVSGNWRINYELSPNNRDPWYPKELNDIPGFSDDNPVAQPVSRSDCRRAMDIISAKDNRVIFQGITCNSFIRNITFNFVAVIKKYDYINGVCEESTKYNTPGIYKSKEACELANKYNLTEEKFNEITQLINNIKGKKCG